MAAYYYYGFAAGLLLAAVVPQNFFIYLQRKYGYPVELQSIYYKGYEGNEGPRDWNKVFRPIERRILGRLKQMDMNEDEEMEQAHVIHDEMMLEIERKELEFLEKQINEGKLDEDTARSDEYEATKRVVNRRIAEGKEKI